MLQVNIRLILQAVAQMNIKGPFSRGSNTADIKNSATLKQMVASKLSNPVKRVNVPVYTD